MTTLSAPGGYPMTSPIGPVPGGPVRPVTIDPRAYPGVPTGPAAARPRPAYWVPAASLISPMPGALPGRRPSWIARWKQRNAGKRWWKFLLVGIAAYIIGTVLLALFPNPNAVPLVILLASAVVPVTFVVYCWERGAFAEMPATALGLTFASGAILGLLTAWPLESLLLRPIPYVGSFTVAVIEESAKALAVVWFLRDRRLRGERDGLTLGAAAGAGFATLETAGYGFTFFLVSFTESVVHKSSVANAMLVGLLTMTVILLMRMALSTFMHVAWTAIVCAAIWRERGPSSTLRITWGVVLAFALSVTFHGLWDSSAELGLFYLLVMPAVAFAGIWTLRFFQREATDRANLGEAAPPPLPLLEALAFYLLHPRRRTLMQAPQGFAPAAWPAGLYTWPAFVGMPGAPAAPIPPRPSMPAAPFASWQNIQPAWGAPSAPRVNLPAPQVAALSSTLIASPLARAVPPLPAQPALPGYSAAYSAGAAPNAPFTYPSSK
jgi:RsiW-degrading membrane proteinase PrsW (M82 family)